MEALWALGLALLGAAAARGGNVTVVRLSLAMEEQHSLTIDMDTEYILSFTPDSWQSQWPSRLWVQAGGHSDPLHPLLATARLRTGASTWQLPYAVDGRLVAELERTLCPDDSGDTSTSDCAGEPQPRGALRVHLSSSCAAPLPVALRVSSASDWALALGHTTHVSFALARPRVYFFGWSGSQSSVRLVAAASDDVCATLAVHNYTCPIAQSLAELGTASLRMTLQRSAATQLSRSRFPRGFYVVAVVHSDDEACTGEPAADDDWLWEAALGDSRHGDSSLGDTAAGDPAPGDSAGRQETRALSSRSKNLTLTITVTGRF